MRKLRRPKLTAREQELSQIIREAIRIDRAKGKEITLKHVQGLRNWHGILLHFEIHRRTGKVTRYPPLVEPTEVSHLPVRYG